MPRLNLVHRALVAGTVAAAAIALSAPSFAVETGMSLYLRGNAGFMAGILPPEEGSYLTTMYYHYDGSAGANARNGLVELGVDINIDFAAEQGTFVTDWHPLGGQYAFGVLVDYAWAGVDSTVNGLSVSPRSDGISDALVQPIILGWHDGNWHFNGNLSVVLPTGEYERTQLSVGRNVWALMPQVAATYFDPQSGWDFSAAATFVVSWRNEATDYLSGDILHLDWAIGKHFGEGWEAGVQGNFAVQITNDTGSGARLGPNKLESIGIGPAIAYSTKFGDTPVSFSAKWEHDVLSHHTFDGDVAMATATVAF